MDIKEVYEKVIHGRYKIFFGDKGLSITEANHKANLLKELAKGISAQFELTAGYHGIIQFDGNKIDADNFTDMDLEGQAKLEGDIYSLTAWLREAIKAKNELLQSIKIMPGALLLIDDEKTPDNWTEIRPQLKQVPMYTPFTLEDALGGLSIPERTDYITIEAKAAHLGKKIHPGGVIHEIRTALQQKRISTFTNMPNGQGMKAYVVQWEALYDLGVIDTLFFRLQSEYRSYEEKLNYLKAQLQNTTTNTNAELQQKYTNAVEAMQVEYKAKSEEWSKGYNKSIMEITKFNSQMEERRLQLTRHIAALKVVIPNALQSLVDKLNSDTKK